MFLEKYKKQIFQNNFINYKPYKIKELFDKSLLNFGIKEEETIKTDNNKSEQECKIILTKGIWEESKILITEAEEEIPKKSVLRCYYELWKTNLSIFVVITTVGSYIACGGQGFSKILALGVGTFLQSGSANTFNQAFEIERDKLMHRTKNRPLCTNSISLTHAITQGFVVGGVGSYLLYNYTNPLTCYLGIFNLLTYSLIYTPLKVRNPL
jgi:heme O synthase-like polyprenyltransferase